MAVLLISVSLRASRYCKVSEIVEVGRCERARTRDSIAATGIVSSGSDCMSCRYVVTMSKSVSDVDTVGIAMFVAAGGSNRIFRGVLKNGRIQKGGRLVLKSESKVHHVIEQGVLLRPGADLSPGFIRPGIRI